MNRTKSFDPKLSDRLQNRRHAQSFILGLIEGPKGLTVEMALKHGIEKMGVKEFAERVGESAPNVVTFLKGRRKLKLDTLDKFLKPFGLRVRLIAERVKD